MLTVIFFGDPVPVYDNEYVPSGILADVKAMLPLVPWQVVGLVAVPAVMVGFKIDSVTTVVLLVAQAYCSSKLVYVPTLKPVIAIALEFTETIDDAKTASLV